MYVVPFSGVVARGEVGEGNLPVDLKLRLPESCPRLVYRMIVGFHVVGQLADHERQMLVTEVFPPAVYEFLEVVVVDVGRACVALALIPYHSGDGIVPQRPYHAVVESGSGERRRPAERSRPESLGGPRAHSYIVFPLAREIYRGLVACEPVGFVRYETGVGGVGCKPYGHDVPALVQHACRYIIFAWRAEIAGASDKGAVHIDLVPVHEASHIDLRMASGHGFGNVYGLPVPYHHSRLQSGVA